MATGSGNNRVLLRFWGNRPLNVKTLLNLGESSAQEDRDGVAFHDSIG
jgi:hypothetical protein